MACALSPLSGRGADLALLLTALPTSQEKEEEEGISQESSEEEQ